MEYTWQQNDAGERVDKVLSRALDVSRTQMQNWIKAGCVLCEQKKLTSKSKLKIGDAIEISPPKPVASEILPEKKSLEIIFEDKDILVLNKKAGEIVHPGAGARQGTLVSALLHHCGKSLSGIGGVERPGIVHRLDKDTSGVLVVAKNDAAHQSLSRQFAERTTQKFYLAYVLGKPRFPSGKWTWNVGRHRVHRQKMTVLQTGGRTAVTEYKILHAYSKITLLELHPLTGRTHQIRVHAAAAGFPIVGDTVYGRAVAWIKEAGVTRHLLHAHKLIFSHPRTNKTLEFIAPLPEDFCCFKKYLTTDDTEKHG
ncbi:MAG: RluA family pseudouridine synthase [Verrucomicrobiota bacterium]